MSVRAVSAISLFSGRAPDPAPVSTVPGGTTVLVELTPDIHICGICKQQFNNLDAFVGHKQSGCQLTSATAGATSTVQFVSEETVPSTQAQTKTRTIASETQTITGILVSHTRSLKALDLCKVAMLRSPLRVCPHHSKLK